jgi:hypothetical protein
MIATKESSLELLRLSGVREILKAPGPCITITVPAYHPGESTGSIAAILKSNFQEIRTRLAAHGVSKTAASDLLAPLERLADEPAAEGGTHWGRIIFRAPSVFEQFRLTVSPAASITVGSMFAIRAIAGEFSRPAAFYVLSLAKTGVSLLRCAGLHAEPVQLPHGAPATLDEAMMLEPPDHDLENRSAANGSPGGLRAVRFGTGSGREKRGLHLADYYKLVDRAIRSLLREGEIPLILEGVEEDCVAYRAVTDCRGLAHRAIPNPGSAIDDEELLRYGYALLAAEECERQANSLRTARERMSRGHFVSDLEEILHAAFSGRIEEFYAAGNAQRTGDWQQGGWLTWNDEDLINVAMGQTLRRHGRATVLPPESMPEGLEMAATLRY